MKRIHLVRHLELRGCRIVREGANDSVFVNPATRQVSTVPRHRDIDEFLARKICRDLQAPVPGV